MTLFNSGTNTNLNIGCGWNERPKSVEDAYPMNDSIWSGVHAKLDFGRWAQDMTPEYEEAVRAFRLVDSKRSDQPGDVS